MTLNGIDVSGFQPKNIFDLVPVDFGIVKATEGTTYVSSECDEQYQDLKKKGKQRGVYHFASVGDAISQAEFFVSHVKGYVGDGVLVLDFEGPAVNQGGSWARTFLDKVKQLTGVTPGFYASESVVKNCPQVAAGGYWLWNANYGANTSRSYTGQGNYAVGAFPFQTIRQYSSVGRLGSYQGNLDLDIAFVDVAGWKKLAAVGGGAVQPTTPAAPSKPAPAPSGNSTVKAQQVWLNKNRGEKLVEDGVRGPATIAAIERYQTALRAYGYTGAIDGLWGTGTQAAHLKEQAAKGNASATPAAPKPATRPTLAENFTGEAVSNLQSLLNRKYPAYSKLKVDGIFGKATLAVVKEFQKRSGLSPDGIVGPKTWAALGS